MIFITLKAKLHFILYFLSPLGRRKEKKNVYVAEQRSYAVNYMAQPIKHDDALFITPIFEKIDTLFLLEGD